MLEVRNLSKLFANGSGASDINFVLRPGSIVGMIGDNGAGKSTIIKTIFNEYKKNSGEILLDGQAINKNDYKKMAFFPDQSIYPKNISIEKYCVYSGCLSGLDKKTSKERTLKLLKYLELFEYRNKKFKVLSAGMQKRALLAITMVSNPEIIVLDEPTANLDVSTRFEFMEILRKLAGRNKTILITSHIINELQGLVDRVLVIKKGRLVYNKALEGNEQIIDIYNACMRQEKNQDELDVFGGIFGK